MNLDQFRYIKNEIIRITNRYDELQNSGLKSEQKEEEIEQLVKKFNLLQEQLLNSNLSQIPFEEWEGFALLSAPNLDFSKTHANIDFSLIKEIDCSKINLKGCNVRGIKEIFICKSVLILLGL